LPHISASACSIDRIVELIASLYGNILKILLLKIMLMDIRPLTTITTLNIDEVTILPLGQRNIIEKKADGNSLVIVI
jgi:hypothetical protein